MRSLDPPFFCAIVPECNIVKAALIDAFLSGCNASLGILYRVYGQQE